MELTSHLLKKDADIRYIKDLLGHFSIKTPGKYLHLKKDQLVRFVSPLDDLWEKQKIHWQHMYSNYVDVFLKGISIH